MASRGSGLETLPRVGMLAIIRKRRGVVSEVRPFDGKDGRYHLVQIDYKDDSRPQQEAVLWELEPSTRLLEPNEVPRAGDEPMPAEDLDALLRASRWTATLPYLDPDAEGPLGRLPISSPFHGAVQIENYQLVPLLKALQMPRVNLLIADDVGLGKTVEAGLILSELLIRRRVNRVLVLTPASLRVQWRDELWSKFALPFDIIDRDTTHRIRRSLGIDANPWRSCSRIITSYHYLRQPDILEQFHAACCVPPGSPRLPWDLLIVDEVHNLMPAPFGDDSHLCQMLRLVVPQFEHRLFLTATPHNGHTRCFTGLLELLDPVRFSRTDELRPAERERVKQVVMRRLKREVNARTDPPLFCTRVPPQAILLDFSEPEQRLITAFEAFRGKVRSAIAGASKRRRLAGRFAIEVLGKRLLSGPVTFIESWRRCKQGLQEDEAADDEEVAAAERSVREETADDREAEQRQSSASTVIGAWLKALADDVQSEIAAIDQAVEEMGIDLDGNVVQQDPVGDVRFEALLGLIDRLVRRDGDWRDDERLVVFTEYKTTLDYLLRRLRATYPEDEDRFLCLFGGMDDLQREQIKDAFNDPDARVRVLIGTDAAAEGLNLQSTARYLLHYDCPWNPSRLEQRNGRLDRHGQARDVHVHHFASEEDSDLKFMAYVISKVDQIRGDLGATGEIFDEATHRRLIEGQDVEEVQKSLEARLQQARGTVSVDADSTIAEDPATGEAELGEKVSALAAELDLDPLAQRDTLEAAMAVDGGRPQLTDLDEHARCMLVKPDLPRWKDVIDETVRRPIGTGGPGRVPYLAFSPKPFIETVEGRPVFRPRIDTAMMHLSHPLMHKAMGMLVRRRFPGPNAVSRWTVRYGDVHEGAEAMVLLHVEELAVNELRETFHHWVRTFRLPVGLGEMGEPLPHKPALEFRSNRPCRDWEAIEEARELLDALEPDLQEFVKEQARTLTERLHSQLNADGEQAREQEERRYQSRQGEVSALIEENTLAKLEREIAQLNRERQQGRLFNVESELEELDRSIEMKREELERRKRHYEEVREQLARERERIIRYLLPRRYALQGEAQVFPLAVEVWLPTPQGGVA